MLIKSIIGILRIIRIDSCVLGAGMIFLPYMLATGNVKMALVFSLPVFFGSAAGFILNDISDAEKDRVNHPGRPIPSGVISVLHAKILFFMAFFLAAASLVSMEGSFGLMLSNAIFLIMMLNYNYTVKDLPWAKNIHVALTAVIPAGFPIWLGIAQKSHGPLLVAILFFLIGREMQMDIVDMKGDGKTLPKILGEELSCQISFGLQVFASSILVIFCSKSDAALYVSTSIGIITILAWWGWRKLSLRGSIITVTKVQLAFGLFLFYLNIKSI